MKVEQLSLFLENRTGRLADVTECLKKNEINIRALSVADTSDFGILRMIVSNHDKAKTALKENGFIVDTTQVVAVSMQDQPGGLHMILKLLQEENINVEYMYAFVQESGENAALIFRFDHIDEAVAALTKRGVKMLSSAELSSF